MVWSGSEDYFYSAESLGVGLVMMEEGTEALRHQGIKQRREPRMNANKNKSFHAENAGAQRRIHIDVQDVQDKNLKRRGCVNCWV